MLSGEVRRRGPFVTEQEARMVLASVSAAEGVVFSDATRTSRPQTRREDRPPPDNAHRLTSYSPAAILPLRTFCKMLSPMASPGYMRKGVLHVVDFFISSSLPPKEMVFVEGKMLDAQV